MKPLIQLHSEHQTRLSPEAIVKRLTSRYGEFEQKPRYGALDELIFTVLTQHTSDLNAGRAFERLKERMPTWDAVLNSSREEVAQAIFHGGMSNQKSARIQAILAAIHANRNAFEIDFLRDYDLESARKWLMELPGVGPKTAAVVMSLALGMPAFPVDTHIHRVCKRLGLISDKTSADDAHTVMEATVAPDLRFQLHMQIITHGRQICKARRPRCSQCVLADGCPARDAR